MIIWTWILMQITFFGNDIAKANHLRREAKEAFNQKQYAEAKRYYHTLIDSMQIDDDAAALNLGHAYYLTKDSVNAEKYYDRAIQADDDAVRSSAYLQKGFMAFQKKEWHTALDAFKSSLLANPENELARYNYEVTKRKIEREQQKKEEEEQMEPSEYAKQLKAKADQLVNEFKFKEALNLMNMGLKQDKTVAAYQNFIDKLAVVTNISEIK